MLVSTRGRYALRVMIDLAENQKDGYIPMKTVAERQDISLKYLERILPSLVKSGYIEGIQGKGGGYKLCRKPEEYSVGEVLDLMEGTLSPVACLNGESNDCPRKYICKTLPMWTEFNDMVHAFFYGKTIRDLVGQEI